MVSSRDTQAAASSRRAFLTGKSAVEALARLADGSSTAEMEATLNRGGRLPAPADQPYLIHFGRRAMACEFEVYLQAGRDRQALPEALAALDLVDELEAQLTVFRDASEVSQINRRAALAPVVVEPGLFRLLQTCVGLFEETEGAFDITSGPLTKTWGFYRRQGTMPTAEALQAALQNVGSDKLELDESARTIRFTQPGVEINLGSIGKGYALDRCAEQLDAAGVGNFLLHGGHSSVLGRGSRDVGDCKDACTAHKGDGIEEIPPAAQGGWQVGVVHPLRPDKRFAEVRLCNRGLATSGAGSQFFRHEGKRYGHILDPRSGWPAQNVVSCTVLAPSRAAEADALATAFFVLGPAKAIEYCKRHAGVSCLLVHQPPGGSPQGVDFGFSPNELRILTPV